MEHVGSDRCRVSVGAWSWPAVAAALARFDARVEVVGPRELAGAFGELAERSAAAAASFSA